jgi:hypothetical protein
LKTLLSIQTKKGKNPGKIQTFRCRRKKKKKKKETFFFLEGSNKKKKGFKNSNFDLDLVESMSWREKKIGFEV